MKLPPVEYRPASDLDEALAILDAEGDDAAVLAGGQSLLLDLRYGRVHPTVLVDVNGVRDLDGLETVSHADGAVLRVGALVRHDRFEAPGRTDPLARLLAAIARKIGHPPIRVRGTFVGSIAWAHPATEWCATARALGADVVVRSRSGGERVVPAADWFLGPGRTARRADELITEVRLPLLPDDTGVGFAEHRRTSASFAMAAALATVRFEGGRLVEAAVGLANAADVPVTADAAVGALLGSDGSAAVVEQAAELAARHSDPHPEPHCPVDYRRQVLRVLVRRALTDAVSEAREAAQQREAGA